MMRSLIISSMVIVLAAAGAEARQLPGGLTKGLSIAKKAQDVRDLQMTDQEEATLGAEVSARIRTRYGVVQDAGVHRYISLLGLALAQGSTRPGLRDLRGPRHQLCHCFAPRRYVHISVARSR